MNNIPQPQLQQQAQLQTQTQQTQQTPEQDQKQRFLQYKIQVLLHINSLLLSKLYNQPQSPQQPAGQTNPQQAIEQKIQADYLKRVHSNLQCISSLHQGVAHARPSILEPPVNYHAPAANPLAPGNTGNTNNALIQQQEEGLRRLYLLLNRMFELW